jgi:hypothetical protein
MTLKGIFKQFVLNVASVSYIKPLTNRLASLICSGDIQNISWMTRLVQRPWASSIYSSLTQGCKPSCSRSPSKSLSSSYLVSALPALAFRCRLLYFLRSSSKPSLRRIAANAVQLITLECVVAAAIASAYPSLLLEILERIWVWGVIIMKAS